MPVQAFAVSRVAAKAVCGIELLFDKYLEHRRSGSDGLVRIPGFRVSRTVLL
jgi:hypothetical protein